MKKTLYKFVTLSVITIALSSCTTTEIPLDELEEPIEATISYNKNVKEIIDNNCVFCHKVGGQAAFLPLTNYIQVKASAENGNLIARMNNASAPMPQNGLLPAQTRAIIDKWKQDGFLEN